VVIDDEISALRLRHSKLSIGFEAETEREVESCKTLSGN
jgi:hypothetical protein